MDQTQLDKMREAGIRAREERLAAGLSTVKTPYERAAENPKSRRLAIHAQCFSCEGEDSDPGWKARIGSCTIPTCPLYSFRPYQQHAGDLDN